MGVLMNSPIPEEKTAPEPTAQRQTGVTDDYYIERGTRDFTHTALALLFAGFSCFSLLYCLQPVLPRIAADYGVSPAESSLALSIPTFCLALGLLVTGPISDAIGRKPVMQIALFSAGVLTVVSALIPNWHVLLICRGLLGFALSGVTAISLTYLAEEIHPRSLGFAVGMMIAGNAFGGMLSRVVVGVASDYMHWHWPVLGVGFFGLAAAFCFKKLLPRSRHFTPGEIKARQLFSGYGQHLRDSVLPWLFLEGFLFMGSMVAFFNYVGFHLMEEPFLLSQSFVGVVSVVYLTGMYSSPQVGTWADRFGATRVFPAIILFFLVGVLCTWFHNLPMMLIGMIIFTFGFFGAHSVASSWVGRRVKTARAQATSLYQFCFYVGASFAGTVGGFFWQYRGWNGVLFMIGCMLVAAFLASLHIARQSGKTSP